MSISQQGFPHGQFFYHYTTREAAFEHILPDRRLRLSPYWRMNDPLEASAPIFTSGFPVPEDPAVVAAMEHAFVEANLEIMRRRRQTKLLSLTVDAPVPEETPELAAYGLGWCRARMWEQYAENAQGVCLVLDREAFTEAALGQLRGREPRSRAGPVIYSWSGMAESGAQFMSMAPGVAGPDIASAHIERFAEDLFFRKLADWESEHEFRFIEPSENDDFTFVDLGETLSAVIVGHRFPGWQEPAASALCAGSRVELYRVGWQHFHGPGFVRRIS